MTPPNNSNEHFVVRQLVVTQETLRELQTKTISNNPNNLEEFKDETISNSLDDRLEISQSDNQKLLRQPIES